MNKKIDLRLYALTDATLSRGRSHSDVIAAAIRGGATIIQYREKSANTRKMIEEARILLDLCRKHKVPFIVNDRLDVAMVVDADGVHVGQDDMPASLARKLIGEQKILGVSAENEEQARQAIADGADYLGAGAVFITATKSDAGNPIGLDGVERIVRMSQVPVVGIGGINASNAAGVIRAGAAGVAVVSAIVNADDVEVAARELKQIVTEAGVPQRTK
jgi:thiamine-phosphate pyrophosphorylase